MKSAKILFTIFSVLHQDLLTVSELPLGEKWEVFIINSFELIHHSLSSEHLISPYVGCVKSIKNTHIHRMNCFKYDIFLGE